MNIRKNIFRFAGQLFFERPAKKKTYVQLLDALNVDGQTVSRRLASASDTAKNRDVANHFIGIERWGQRRLKVALGEAMVDDEHDGYRPDADGTPDMNTLRDAFDTTRQETLQLIRQLNETQVPGTKTVRHNDFGDFTVKGWLEYLNGHSKIESKGLKS